MPWAEFEEKQYETVVAVELAEHQGRVFSAGQVLEKVVGFDAAAAPTAANVIWQILRTPRPRGVHLAPPIWAPGAEPRPEVLPRTPVSLLLQYKRPEFLYGPRASQWLLWQRPYFRFTPRRAQHTVLNRLERRLETEAIVRYAAPAFWRLGDLEYAHLRRRVIERTGFVSPSVIGRHRVWTYTEPGVDGRPNPVSRARRFETFADLFSEFDPGLTQSQQLARHDEPLFAHLELLGVAAREREPTLRRAIQRWLDSLRAEQLDLSGQTLARIADIAAITSLMKVLGGSWHVVEVREDHP